MQHKNTFDESELFEYSEGQQRLLCCNEASFGCPSLHLSPKQAKQNLLDRGMIEEDYASLMGLLKGIAKGFIDEEVRNIKSNNNQDKYV